MRLPMSILTKLFLSHFAVIVLVSGSAGTYFYFSAVDNLMQALQSRLQNSAALVSEGIDASHLGQIRAAVDMASAEYREYIETLRGYVRANPDIAYIYVMRKEGERVEFVLDSDTDQPASPGEEYPHRIPSLLEGFVRPSVDDEITGDRWGRFLSGYSPLDSEEGEYLVGIDMRADEVHAKFEEIRLAGLLSLAFSLVLAAVFAGLLARSFTHRILALGERFARVGPVDEAALNATGGDELDRVSATFDAMAAQLAAKQRSLTQARDQLEQRVEERTAELVRTNEQLLEEIAERRRVEKMLEQASRTDYLTGVLNRRAMTRRLEEYAQQPGHAGAAFTVVLVDIDHFKQVNDAHGHDVGDRALVQFAEELRAGLRDSDLLGRWGGEEFLLLLPHTRQEQAAALAERLRVRIAEMRLDLPVDTLRLTGSFGVAEFLPGDDLDRCLKRADEALYRAKARGRNRVEEDGDGEGDGSEGDGQGV